MEAGRRKGEVGDRKDVGKKGRRKGRGRGQGRCREEGKEGGKVYIGKEGEREEGIHSLPGMVLEA